MIYVKIKNFYRIGNWKTHLLLMRNIVSLARFDYITLHFLIFKLPKHIEITESPGHVTYRLKDHKKFYHV